MTGLLPREPTVVEPSPNCVGGAMAMGLRRRGPALVNLVLPHTDRRLLPGRESLSERPEVSIRLGASTP